MTSFLQVRPSIGPKPACMIAPLAHITEGDACMQLFFPTVIAAKASAAAQASSPYCQFDDMFLVLWTSSMFAAGTSPLLMHCCLSWPAGTQCLLPYVEGRMCCACLNNSLL
jgi:hypothetical protein